jgi:hypothetical protein
MKNILIAVAAIAAVFVVAHAAIAFMGLGHGRGMGHGMMGPYMMAQAGGGPIGPGMHGPGAMHGAQITEDQAKAIGQKYVDEQFKGFTIDKIVASTGMPHTMYTIELKGPQGETKTLHVSPFGHVMPLSSPLTRG